MPPFDYAAYASLMLIARCCCTCRAMLPLIAVLYAPCLLLRRFERAIFAFRCRYFFAYDFLYLRDDFSRLYLMLMPRDYIYLHLRSFPFSFPHLLLLAFFDIEDYFHRAYCIFIIYYAIVISGF